MAPAGHGGCCTNPGDVAERVLSLPRSETLIEADHFALKMLREEARPASDIQHASGDERTYSGDELVDFSVPAQPHTLLPICRPSYDRQQLRLAISRVAQLGVDCVPGRKPRTVSSEAARLAFIG